MACNWTDQNFTLQINVQWRWVKYTYTRENISLPVDKQVILSSEELGNIANILISQTGKCWENLG